MEKYMQPGKIIDSLCYVPTKEVILDLIVSLPPQMARYLKDVFGPRVAPLLSMDADTLYQLPLSNREEWEGEPVIGLKYPHDAPAKLIFLSFTLHNANGKGNVIEVLREFLER